jgi:putative addiction module component (TIGR02574 family)
MLKRETSPRDQVLEQALALAPEDRAYVVEALESSLSLADFASPEIGEAWFAEIERRAVACERGEMPSADWRTVMARLRDEAASTKPAAS